jgi:hypothetical protein
MRTWREVGESEGMFRQNACRVGQRALRKLSCIPGAIGTLFILAAFLDIEEPQHEEQSSATPRQRPRGERGRVTCQKQNRASGLTS